MENYTVALTTIKMMNEHVNLGFTYRQFFEYCQKEITNLNEIMAESNLLSEFWKIVEILLDQETIVANLHFKLDTRSDVRISRTAEEIRASTDKKNTQTHTFAEPKRLLYIRLSAVHGLYMKEKRSQTGKGGQGEKTIESYLKDQPYYIGNCPAAGFAGNTSAFVFDYDKMSINLDRFKDEKLPLVTISGKVLRDAETVDVDGVAKLIFSIVQDESYPGDDGQPVKKHVHTTCHCSQRTDALLLKKDREVKLTGTLTEKRTTERVYRTMQVTKIEFTELLTPVERDVMF